MALEITEIQKRLEDKFLSDVSDFRIESGVFTFHSSAKAIKEVVRYMHIDEVLRFNFLTDLCAVHYPDNEKQSQFAVVYLLHNWIDNVRVRIKVFLPAEKVEVDTVTDIFAAANWLERETYDFFGVKFIGHPNLKRIMNDEGMTVFPMRKEYPMEDPERTDKDDRFFGRTPLNYQQSK